MIIPIWPGPICHENSCALYTEIVSTENDLEILVIPVTPVNLLSSRKDNFITHKVLSRNKIKYFSSLKIKKFRDLNGQFLIEGDKIVKDTLQNGQVTVSQLIATKGWLSTNQGILSPAVKEVCEADILDLSRITSFETPPPVIALLDITKTEIDLAETAETLSIALDNIQDPGNLGTIIRTADWFGVQYIFCSEGCADMYNPKVIQASMGAFLNMKVHYVNLKELLMRHSTDADYRIYGTFLDGTPVSACAPVKRGLIVFGNESQGISDDLLPFIKNRITIQPGNPQHVHVESLNVASAVAVLCAFLNRK
jgi:TrmH family RNA methyltransferase